jgi:hypothetical protein
MYYRIAHALGNAKDSFTRSCRDGNAIGYLVGCLYLNVLVIWMLVGYWIFDIHCNNIDTIKSSILYVLLPLLIISLFLKPDDKAYSQMELKYKDEKHRKLKGWLIIAYIVFSIILPICVMFFVGIDIE